MNKNSIIIPETVKDISKEELPVKIVSLSSANEALESGYEYYAKQVKSILPDLPPVDIAMKGVNYAAKQLKSEEHGVINILQGFYNEIRNAFACDIYENRPVVKNITFRFKPGTSTLVMGPPCCGTSTLLKLLANTLPESQISGSITCNGKKLKELNWSHYSSFCGQLDVHLPLLSVKDTFDFAVGCLNGKGEMKSKGHSMIEDDINIRSDLFLKLLGLGTCKDTIVGDAVHRGCSGGEMKRVSLGESLLGPSRVLLLDKISTGLDSAVTFDICKFLNQWTKIFEGILVCHLLQPDPEVIALFDNIIILSEGQIIYAGACDGILPYFNSIGYEMIEGKDLGAFICEVGKEETRVVYRKDEAIPLRTQYLVEKYEMSDLKKKNLESVNEKVEKTEVPKNDYNETMFNKSHPMPFWHELMYLMKRQGKCTFMDKGFLIARIIQQIIMGLIFGWLFFDIKKDDYTAKTGLISTVVMTLVSTTNSVVIGLFFSKPVMYKQVQSGLFSVPTYVTSVTINQYPIQLIETLLFGSIIYFMSGLTLCDNGVHYWICMGYLFVGYVNYTSLQLMLLYLFKNIAILSAFIPIIGFFLNSFNGFGITRKTIPDWLIEFYYFTPLSYMIKGLAVNEFTSSDYGEDGILYLKEYDFPTDKNEQWQYFLILICEHIIFVLLQMIVLHYIVYDPFPPSKSVSIKDVKAVDVTRQSEMSMRSSTSEVKFKSIDFSFEHVKYTVQIKDPTSKNKVNKVLLNDVSGYVRSHNMTALMGASGAGKTTLLDVLANRKTQGKIEGKFLLNGKEYKMKDLCMISGYVEQQDTLPETETVMEALMFSARLRYPGHPSEATIYSHIKEVIELLELKEYKDMMIGPIDSGLPMGVRKLVMVGIELAANPSILFLDEPTTGLDSSAALLVCQVLQRIAISGRSIICTIHQPSFEIFKLFSDVLLLERGGKVVYLGPLGENGSKVVEYMEKIDGVSPIGKDQNPASWMLDVTGAGTRNTKNVKFGDYYLTTDLHRKVEITLENIKTANSPAVNFKEDYAVSITKQIWEVSKRNFRFDWRLLEYNTSKFRNFLLMSLFTGILYFQQPMETSGNVLSRLSALSFGINTVVTNNLVSVIPILMDRRMVFYREDAMRTYHPIAQLIGYVLVEILFLFFVAWCYICFSYGMMGLKSTVAAVFKEIVVDYSMMIFATMCGIMFAYTFPVMQIAGVVMGCSSSILFACSGFQLRYPSLKAPWKWIYWINPFAFGIQASTANQFDCEKSVINITNCPSFTSSDGSITTIHEFFSNMYDIRYSEYWNNIGYLWIEIVIVIICIYLALKKVRYLDR